MTGYAASVAGRHEAVNGYGDAGYGHGLEPDFARTCEQGVEESFAAEQFVLQTGDLPDLHVDAALKCGDVAGVDDKLFARGEGALDYVAVYLDKYKAAA